MSKRRKRKRTRRGSAASTRDHTPGMVSPTREINGPSQQVPSQQRLSQAPDPAAELTANTIMSAPVEAVPVTAVACHLLAKRTSIGIPSNSCVTMCLVIHHALAVLPDRIAP